MKVMHKRVYEAVIKRMELFDWNYPRKKTRILPFGRYSVSRETFDFLGFLHISTVKQEKATTL